MLKQEGVAEQMHARSVSSACRKRRVSRENKNLIAFYGSVSRDLVGRREIHAQAEEAIVNW